MAEISYTKSVKHSDQKVAYKVLQLVNNTLISSSLSINDFACVHYNKNKVIIPKIPNSKLFVFDTLEHAKDFSGDEQIWQVHAFNLHVPPCPFFDRPIDFEAFWEEIYNKGYSNIQKRCPATLPTGTLWCDSLRLVTKLYP